jgi:hypothetical protein
MILLFHEVIFTALAVSEEHGIFLWVCMYVCMHKRTSIARS